MIQIYQLETVISWDACYKDKIVAIPVHFIYLPLIIVDDKKTMEELKRTTSGQSLFHFGENEPTKDEIRTYLERGLSRGNSMKAKNVVFSKYNLKRAGIAEKA